MPLYYYKAKSFSGENKVASEEARDEHDLAQKLHETGFLLIKSSDKPFNQTKMQFLESLFNRISLQEKMVLARNLASMLEAGLPLSKALAVLLKQDHSPAFKKILTVVEAKIREGSPFSEALNQFPDTFDNFFVSMVAVGESTGNLEGSLRLVGDRMKKDYEVRSKVKGAMIYPTVIFILMIAVGIIMMTMFVPRLAETFEELNITLPPLTRAIVWIAHVISAYIYLIIGGLAVTIFGSRFLFKKTYFGKRLFDTFMIKTPGLKNISQLYNCARFSRTMSSLTSGGVPIVKSLGIGVNTLSNGYYQDSLKDIMKKVQKGESLSSGLGSYEKLYPPMVLQMVEVGEQSGSMDKVLVDLASFYEDEISEIVKNLSSLLEPVIMVVVAVMVGIFAIAMIQPLYGMLSAF